MKKTTLPFLTLASLLAFGSLSASAQPQRVQAQWGASSRHDYQRPYDDGYRVGVGKGERDARSGRPRDYRRHGEFRRGRLDNGLGWGSYSRRSEDAFRRGFVEGYLSGYDQVRGGYGRQGYPDGRGGYGHSQVPRGGTGYPGDGYGYPGGGGYGNSPATQRGFEDGYRDGYGDAQDRDRYEPTRKKKYREGDEGYNSRYGSRDQYKYDYRAAFQQGYERGYREGRYR